eukprot:1148785-Pelagomonas_calceolata.AAC.2
MVAKQPPSHTTLPHMLVFLETKHASYAQGAQDGHAETNISTIDCAKQGLLVQIHELKKRGLPQKEGFLSKTISIRCPTAQKERKKGSKKGRLDCSPSLAACIKESYPS